MIINREKPKIQVYSVVIHYCSLPLEITSTSNLERDTLTFPLENIERIGNIIIVKMGFNDTVHTINIQNFHYSTV